MVEGMDETFAELLRISTCPYTPNLKKLHALVQEADVKSLQYWARYCPCQIDSVAAAILEGVDLWPFALDLLRIFLRLPAFRDAALQQRPLLLHTLLARTIESNHGFAKFAPACISMLSAALTVTIPANVPIFLEKLFEEIAQSRSSESIRSVHGTLSGLGSDFLDGLSADVLARFQNHLAELLTQLDMDDPFANLLCLAVLAKFASRPCGSPVLDTLTSPGLPLSKDAAHTAPTDAFSPARKYFVGKRAPKTFDLAILKVINACSRNSTLSPGDALETLMLSQEIIDALVSDDRKCRIEKNGGMIRNLYEKILRPDLHRDLQSAVVYQALNFVTAMFDGLSLPGELKPLVERAVSASASSDLTPRALMMCTVSLRPTIISESVIKLLRLASTERILNSVELADFDDALRALATTHSLVSTNSDLRCAILKKLATADGLAALQQFVDQEPPRLDLKPGHGVKNVCPAAYNEAKTRLRQRLVVMILSIRLRSPTSNPDFGDLLTTMVEKQTKLLNAPSLCLECRSNDHPHGKGALALFEAGRTPRTQTASHNWRENVIRELSRDVSRQHEAVIRIVGEICRDLELRCDEAERPFREEQCKSCDLQAKLDESQTQVTELENRMQCQKSELDDMRSERNSFAMQAETSEERLLELSKQLDQMHRAFDQAKSEHERAAQAAQEQSRQQDLDYISILTGKDLALEEQANRLIASRGRIRELEDELAQGKLRALQDAQTINCSEARLEKLNSNIVRATALADSRLVDIKRLTTSEAHLMKSKESMAKVAKEAAEQHQILMSEQTAYLQAEKEKLEELKHKYEHYANMKEAKIQSLEDIHKSSCKKLEADLEEARKNAAMAHKENTFQITDLKKKIRQLRKERGERAQEIAEARTMKTGFMAFMSQIKDQPAPIRNQSRTSLQAIAEDNREQRSPQSDPAASFCSSTSSEGGPTPKRNRRHRTPPLTQTAMMFKPLKPGTNTRSVRRSTIRSPRTPLADAYNTPNASQATETQRIQRIQWQKPLHNKTADGEALQENKEVQDRNSEDESFDGEDIFTSTDQRQLSALRSRTPKLPRESFDGTTTEF